MIINASPLIIFGKLNRIGLLKRLYGIIEIANEVYQEVVVRGAEKNAGDALIVKEHVDAKDIKIIELTSKHAKTAKKIQLIYSIDLGEAETIALALQQDKKEVMIDEKAAREAAKAFGLKPIGTLGILLRLYRNSLISRPEINDLVNKMTETKYRFGPSVLIEFWSMLDRIKK